MNKMDPEKLVVIAASMSLEISKNKSLDQIIFYKNLFSLISNNLQGIYQQIILNQKK